MRYLLSILLFASAGLAAEKEPFGIMHVEEVAAKLKTPDFFVFDSNSKETYLEGHVPGAKWVNFSKFTETELPKKKNSILVFYCKNEH